MEKYIDLDKRSKKEQKEYYKSLRRAASFNTGTRSMKSKKHPSRQEEKKNLQKILDNDF
jgi:hypothetical protein